MEGMGEEKLYFSAFEVFLTVFIELKKSFTMLFKIKKKKDNNNNEKSEKFTTTTIIKMPNC